MPLVPNEISARIAKYLTKEFGAASPSVTVSDDGSNYEVSATCTIPLSWAPGPEVIEVPNGATITINPPASD